LEVRSPFSEIGQYKKEESEEESEEKMAGRKRDRGIKSRD
jgi:hypothetical protein